MFSKREKLKLNSIDEEAFACRKAFQGVKIGALVLHCHHTDPAETLIEDAEYRIQHILEYKPEHERALRLRLFRPVSENQLKADAKWKETYLKRKEAAARWQEAYITWSEWSEAREKWLANGDGITGKAEWQEQNANFENRLANLMELDAKLENLAHEKLCVAGCPWNGRTIFPK